MIWLFVLALVFAPSATIQTMIDVSFDLTTNQSNGTLKAYFGGEWYLVGNAPIFVWVEDTTGINTVCYTYTNPDGTFQVDFSSFTDMRTLYFLFCSADQDITSSNNSLCYPEGWTAGASVCPGGLSSPAGEVILQAQNGTIYEDWFNWGYLSSRFVPLSPFNNLDDAGDSTPFMGLILVGALISAMAIAQNPSLLGWFSFSYFIQGNSPPGWYNRSGSRSTEGAMIAMVEDGSDKHITGSYAGQKLMEFSAEMDRFSLEAEKNEAIHEMAQSPQEEARKRWAQQQAQETEAPEQPQQEERPETQPTTVQNQPMFHGFMAGFYDVVGDVADFLGKPAELITQGILSFLNAVEPASQDEKNPTTTKLKAFFYDVLVKFSQAYLGYNIMDEINTIQQQKILDKAREGLIELSTVLNYLTSSIDIRAMDLNKDGYISKEEIERLKRENPAAYAILMHYIQTKGEIKVEEFEDKVLNEIAKDLAELKAVLRSVSDLNSLLNTARVDKDGMVIVSANLAKILGIKEGERISKDELEELYQEKVRSLLYSMDEGSKLLLLVILSHNNPELAQKLAQLNFNKEEKINFSTDNVLLQTPAPKDLDNLLLEALKGDKDHLDERLATAFALLNMVVGSEEVSFEDVKEGKVSMEDFIRGFIVEAKMKGFSNLSNEEKEFLRKVLGMNDEEIETLLKSNISIDNIVNPILERLDSTNAKDLLNDIKGVGVVFASVDIDKLKENAKWLKENASQLVYGQVALAESILSDSFSTPAQKQIAQAILANINILSMGGIGDVNHLTYQALGRLVLLNMALAIQHQADQANQTHPMAKNADEVLDRDKLMYEVAAKLAPILGSTFEQAVKDMEKLYEKANELASIKEAQTTNDPDFYIKVLSAYDPELAQRLQEEKERLAQEMGIDPENMSPEKEKKLMEKLRSTEAYKEAQKKLERVEADYERAIYSVSGMALTGELSMAASMLASGSTVSSDVLSGDRFNPRAYYYAGNAEHTMPLDSKGERILINLDSEQRARLNNLYQQYLDAKKDLAEDPNDPEKVKKLKETMDELYDFLQDVAKEQGYENAKSFVIPMGGVGAIEISGIEDKEDNILSFRITHLSPQGVPWKEGPIDALNYSVYEGRTLEMLPAMLQFTLHGNPYAEQFLNIIRNPENARALAYYYYQMKDYNAASTILKMAGITAQTQEEIENAIFRGVEGAAKEETEKKLRERANQVLQDLEVTRVALVNDINQGAVSLINGYNNFQAALSSGNSEKAISIVVNMPLPDEVKERVTSLIKEGKASEALSYLKEAIQNDERMKQFTHATGNIEGKNADLLERASYIRYKVTDNVDFGMLIGFLIAEGRVEDARKLISNLDKIVKTDENGNKYIDPEALKNEVDIDLENPEIIQKGKLYIESYQILKSSDVQAPDITSPDDYHKFKWDTTGGMGYLGVSPVSPYLFQQISDPSHARKEGFSPLVIYSPKVNLDKGLLDEVSASTLRKIGTYLDNLDITGYGYDALGKSLIIRASEEASKGAVITKDNPMWEAIDSKIPEERKSPSYAVVEVDPTKTKLEEVNVTEGTIVVYGNKVYQKTEDGFEVISDDPKLIQMLSLEYVSGLSAGELDLLRGKMAFYAVHDPEKFRELYSKLQDGVITEEERSDIENELYTPYRIVETPEKEGDIYIKDNKVYMYTKEGPLELSIDPSEIRPLLTSSDTSLHDIMREVEAMTYKQQFSHKVWGNTPYYNYLQGLKLDERKPILDVAQATYVLYKIGNKDAVRWFKAMNDPTLSPKEREVAKTYAELTIRVAEKTLEKMGISPEKFPEYVARASKYSDIAGEPLLDVKDADVIKTDSFRGVWEEFILPGLPQEHRDKLHYYITRGDFAGFKQYVDSLPPEIKRKLHDRVQGASFLLQASKDLGLKTKP